MEGVQYLETVFSQTGSGALLVCGVSGAGGSGCGKTSLAKLLCKAVSGHPHYANVILVNCTALRGTVHTMFYYEWDNLCFRFFAGNKYFKCGHILKQG